MSFRAKQSASLVAKASMLSQNNGKMEEEKIQRSWYG